MSKRERFDELNTLSTSIFKINMDIISMKSSLIGEPYARKYNNTLEEMSMDLDDMRLSVKKLLRLEKE